MNVCYCGVKNGQPPESEHIEKLETVKYAFTMYETSLHAVIIVHNISHTYDLRPNQQQWFGTKCAVFKNI